MGYKYPMSIQDQENKQLLLNVAVVRAKAHQTRKDLARYKETVNGLMRSYQMMKARMRRM